MNRLSIILFIILFIFADIWILFVTVRFLVVFYIFKFLGHSQFLELLLHTFES